MVVFVPLGLVSSLSVDQLPLGVKSMRPKLGHDLVGVR